MAKFIAVQTTAKTTVYVNPEQVSSIGTEPDTGYTIIYLSDGTYVKTNDSMLNVLQYLTSNR